MTEIIEHKGKKYQVEQSAQNDSSEAQTDAQTQTPLKASPEYCEESTSAEGTTVCKEKDDRAYFIEVLGFKHPEAQKVTVTPLNGNDNDKLYGFDGKLREKQETTDTSTIHRWETMDDKPLAAQLEIKKTDGEVMKIPLFSEVELTNKMPIRQDYIIAPFVPLVQHFEDGTNKPCGPVSSRPGYLYIYRNYRLWREIQISMDDSGLPIFKDSDLTAARNGDLTSPFSEAAKRKFVGASMDEIWLPVRSNGAREKSINGFFSEVKLTNERLNYLESTPNELLNRLTSFGVGEPDTCFPGRSNSDLVWLSSVAPQRPRNEDIEFQSCEPYRYLTDLTGEYLKSECEYAESVFPDIYVNSRDYIDDVKGGGQSSKRKISSAVLLDLVEIETNRANKTCLKIWQEQGDSTDVFGETKQRKICGLVFDDHIYQLKHALVEYQTNQALLQALNHRSETHRHYDFANLVNRVIVPSELKITNSQGVVETIKNEYHKEYASYVDLDRKAKINQILTTELNSAIVQRIKYAQTRLFYKFRAQESLYCFRDFFSLNEDEYKKGYKLLSPIANAIAINPQRVDSESVAKNPDMPSYSKEGTDFLEPIFMDETNPYHKILFPKEEVVSVFRPLSSPPPISKNTGDGQCRPDLLYRLKQAAEKAEKECDEKTHDNDVKLIDIESVVVNGFSEDETNNNIPIAALLKRLFNDADNFLAGLSGAEAAIIAKLEDAKKVKLAKARAKHTQAQVALFKSEIHVLKEWSIFSGMQQHFNKKKKRLNESIDLVLDDQKNKVKNTNHDLSQATKNQQHSGEVLTQAEQHRTTQIDVQAKQHEAKMGPLADSAQQSKEQLNRARGTFSDKWKKLQQAQAAAEKSIAAELTNAKLKVRGPLFRVRKVAEHTLLGEVIILEKGNITKKYRILGRQLNGHYYGKTNTNGRASQRFNSMLYDSKMEAFGGSKTAEVNKKLPTEVIDALHDSSFYVVEVGSKSDKNLTALAQAEHDFKVARDNLIEQLRTDRGFALKVSELIAQHKAEQQALQQSEDAKVAAAAEENDADKIATAQAKNANDKAVQSYEDYLQKTKQQQQAHDSNMQAVMKKRAQGVAYAQSERLARQMSVKNLETMVNDLLQLQPSQLASLAAPQQASCKIYMEKLLNHPATSLFVLGLEVWNLQAELSAFNSFLKQGRGGRAIIGNFSALYDTTFALIYTYEKIKMRMGHATVLTRFMDTQLLKAADMATLKRTRPIMHAIRVLLPRVVTTRLAFAVIGVGLTLFVCYLDIKHLMAMNDNDAAKGMAAMTAGIAVLAFCSLYGIGLTGLLGMVPIIGWLLVVTGFFAFVLFKDSPMQELLAGGPLAAEPGLKYLDQDGGEAFYRLAHMLSGYQVNRGFNPYYNNPNAVPAEITDPDSRVLISEANYRVTVSTALPSLFTDIRCESRFALATHAWTPNEHEQVEEEIVETGIQPIYAYATAQGNEYFFDIPKSLPFFLGIEHAVVPRFQFIAQHHGITRVFPAPASSEFLAYRKESHGHANFEANTDFWLGPSPKRKTS